MVTQDRVEERAAVQKDNSRLSSNTEPMESFTNHLKITATLFIMTFLFQFDISCVNQTYGYDGLSFN